MYRKTIACIEQSAHEHYLKEIADVCGIHKNLSTHTARHSYATTVCMQIIPLINSALLCMI